MLHKVFADFVWRLRCVFYQWLELYLFVIVGQVETTTMMISYPVLIWCLYTTNMLSTWYKICLQSPPSQELYNSFHQGPMANQYWIRKGVWMRLAWSINAVTTRSFGNFLAKLAIPSGLAMRFKNKILSSGTPLESKTSTAMVADPPTAEASELPWGSLNRASYRLQT